MRNNSSRCIFPATFMFTFLSAKDTKNNMKTQNSIRFDTISYQPKTMQYIPMLSNLKVLLKKKVILAEVPNS